VNNDSAFASDESELHQQLRLLNELRLRPVLEQATWPELLSMETERRVMENRFLASQAVEVSVLARHRRRRGFLAWFEALRERPGQ
jgi:hypothetical protein